MNVNISYTSEKPMYEQIEDSIKKDIFEGRLKNNEMLPSVRQLAKDLNVSAITTKRAYMDLERDGLIYTIAGKGTFVKADDIGNIQSAAHQKALEEFDKAARQAKEYGIEKKALEGVLDEIYGGSENE